MADVVQSLYTKKKEGEFKGDLANDKPLGSSGKGASKFGLGPARYKFIIDSPVSGVESIYFWLIRFMEERPPFGLNLSGEWGRIEKIKDMYTAGETSSYWGMAEQRKGLQQDKFQQLMANVGQLLKTLFQLIRELRIIDERLEFYKKSYAGDRSAEIALKSIWIDLVEGGSKNPASVLGLGSQVGFVTLPDLFFAIHPKKDDVRKEVDKLGDPDHGGINRKVREVLERKLTQYLYWKEKTYDELLKGEKFKTQYLRQHYHVIRLYLNWLRPYLKNVQRLQMQGTATDKDIIAAFETSKIEVELLGIETRYEAEGEYGKETKDFKEFFPVIRVKLNHVAMPEIAFQSEGQRGAIHRGRTVVIIEAFVAQVQKEGDKVIRDDLTEYKSKIDKEDLELLEAVDASIMAMKDDLEKYLLKAGELAREQNKDEKKGESVGSPFKHLFLGFKELAGIPTLHRKDKTKNVNEKGAAENDAKTKAYTLYNIYKKTHGMFTE